MKLPADSVVLASCNCGLVCLTLLARATHIGCCAMGGPANVTATVIIPTLLLVSVFFIVRDIRRQHTRRQGLIAAVLLFPGLLLLFAPRAL